MARRKTTAKAKTETAETTPATEPVTDAVNEDAGTPIATEPQESVNEVVERPPAKTADPQAKISVGLSGYQGGPSMHLLRSQKFNQMQIRFDREQPDEQFLAMLQRAGWKDRTEAEGVWTKQIDRAARWQSVQQMEREFREVANAIRQEKGLKPALEGMAMA